MRNSVFSFVFVSVSLLAMADSRAADLIDPYADGPGPCTSCSGAERHWIGDERDADDVARWRQGYRSGLAEGARRGWVDPCACGALVGRSGNPVPVAPSYVYWYAYAYGTAF